MSGEVPFRMLIITEGGSLLCTIARFRFPLLLMTDAYTAACHYNTAKAPKYYSLLIPLSMLRMLL